MHGKNLAHVQRGFALASVFNNTPLEITMRVWIFRARIGSSGRRSARKRFAEVEIKNLFCPPP
jgi:hypothetical protein